jgi:hypothetical protein
MRTTVTLGALVAALITNVQPSRASQGPWCAHYFGTDYTVSCDMRSFAMCLDEIRGISGTFCSPNPNYRPASVVPAPYKHARRHHPS